MHTDDDFRRKIRENPFDDAIRMVYADWLEDRAHEEGSERKCETCRGIGLKTSRWRIAEMDADDYGESTSRCGLCSGIGRIPNPRVKWAEFIRLSIERNSNSAINVEVELLNFLLDHPETNIPSEIKCFYDRGFVNSISCTLDQFLRNTIEIFATHPVTAVRLTNRQPARGPGGYWWGVSQLTHNSDDLPHTILVKLNRYDLFSSDWYSKSFPTEDAANLALSRACVDYGRALVGLPPIAWPTSGS